MTVELVDYRQHQPRDGQGYDRIVSIEMLEAVGHAYLGAFFATCDRLLKPNGLLFVQVITMPDSRYELYRSRPDFINIHIFPGGCCPSLTALCSAATLNSKLQIASVNDIGPHYARTLDIWAQRFTDAWPEISRSGHYDDRFFRKCTGFFPASILTLLFYLTCVKTCWWTTFLFISPLFLHDFLVHLPSVCVSHLTTEIASKGLYYFRYCQVAFETRTLGDLQILWTRPCNVASLPAVPGYNP